MADVPFVWVSVIVGGLFTLLAVSLGYNFRRSSDAARVESLQGQIAELKGENAKLRDVNDELQRRVDVLEQNRNRTRQRFAETNDNPFSHE